MSDAAKTVGFISRRMNHARGMPRSIRVMRAVAATGIAIAVAALIIAVSIGRGFENAYSRALLDFNSHVVVMGTGEIENPDEVIAKLRSFEFSSDEEGRLAHRLGWLTPWIDDALDLLDRGGLIRFIPDRVLSAAAKIDNAARRGVVAATPFLYREALIVGGGEIRGVVIKGIDPATLRKVSGISISLFDDSGSIKDALGFGSGSDVPVIVGESLAREMGLKRQGPSLRMMVPGEKNKKRSGAGDFIEVRVVGTFASGMHDYDAQFMLMALPLARRIFEAPKTAVTGIELRLDDAARAGLVADSIERQMGPVYRAISWDELNSDLLAAVRLEKFVSALIMGIMLVVAALNIVATLVLMTIFRMPEIAILKALGLSEKKVGRIFIRGGMRVGMYGIAAGLFAGLGIAFAIERLKLIPIEAEIYLVDSLPIDISGPICGMLALFCGAVIYMTSRLAAHRLANVPPAEGLAAAR